MLRNRLAAKTICHGMSSRKSGIHASQVRLLYGNANVGLGVTLLVSTVLAFIQWPVVSHSAILCWWAYMIVVSAVRYVSARLYRAASPGDAQAGIWGVSFAVLAGLAGGGWGSAGIFLYADAQLTNQVFLVFVLGGMMLGAASLLAPRPESFLPFLLLAGIVPAVRLFCARDQTHQAMGLLAAAFTIAIVLTTRQIHRTIESSISLQFENEALITELQASKKDTEALNLQLEFRVQERTAELHQSNERLRAEIRQREQAEKELLRTRKLESVGVLARGIAHDFNNFLTIVSGNLEMLRTDLAMGTPVDELLDQIAGACQRATFLSSQLLTFAKGGSPVRQLVSIASLVRSAVQLAQAGAEIRFDFRIDDDLWCAEADPGQISQVLHNILLNARQAMSESGIIEVRAVNAHHDVDPRVSVSIRDYGCGIAPEVLPRIFDPYFTTKAAGSGLGLATAYAIIAKHAGQIEVESVPGNGTVFTVTLPACMERPAQEPGVVGQAADQRLPGRLLVMDDEDYLRRLLQSVLTKQGYVVESVRDGDEAIAMFEAARHEGKPFDAVLLDLTVKGGMGGTEAAAKIRELDPSARLIVTSGYSDSPVMANFGNYGFCDVIPKPWTSAALNAVFRRVLSATPHPAL